MAAYLVYGLCFTFTVCTLNSFLFC